jgi:hypothetical protein
MSGGAFKFKRGRVGSTQRDGERGSSSRQSTEVGRHVCREVKLALHWESKGNSVILPNTMTETVHWDHHLLVTRGFTMVTNAFIIARVKSLA